MKQTILFAALGAAALGASAQEVGLVVSSQPIVQQVAVPRQVCNNQVVQAPPSGGGALLGSIAGGALGSTLGGGGGHAVGLGVGAILGAVVGNSVEASGNTRVVPNCITENTYENRTVGYNVTYEYAGRQYTTQMANDPGRTVNLNIAPVGAMAQGNVNLAQGQVVTAPAIQGQAQVMQPQVVQPQVVQTAPVMVAAPAPVYTTAYPYPYPAYPVYRPYYPPISLSFGYVWGGHRHWR